MKFLFKQACETEMEIQTWKDRNIEKRKSERWRQQGDREAEKRKRETSSEERRGGGVKRRQKLSHQ